MRPEDFSPGNAQECVTYTPTMEPASMRPEDFSPGNFLYQYAKAFDDALLQ